VSRHVDFTRGARFDFQEAFDWVETQEADLGRGFLKQVDVVVAAIAARLESFPVRHGAFRRALVRKFPYAVDFQVDEEKVVVTAIVHGARDPRHLLRLLGRKY
jgi:plasmid stabilization system protein ParE